MNRTFVKFCIVFSAFLFFFTEIHAVPKKIQAGQEAWRSLKKALDAFDENDFGSAIKFADQAKDIRRQDAEWQIYVLEDTLKKNRVRRAGDSIERVLVVLEEMGLSDAVKIINSHIEKMGAEYFENSYSRLMDFLSVYAYYPEADYLLGKIYRLEGEFDIALEYMKKAYDNSMNLDVPMERYDLLYDMASLSYDLGNEEDYEKYLLVIASDDELYTDEGYMSALMRIINSDTIDSVEKFFMLYRCNDDVALKAFLSLGKYYMSENENEKALRCTSFASIIAITKIESVLTQRINGFEYTSFKSLISTCANYNDIVEWGNKNGIWELFCDFADAASNSGKKVFSETLFTELYDSEPEFYWKRYAAEKLEDE